MYLPPHSLSPFLSFPPQLSLSPRLSLCLLVIVCFLLFLSLFLPGDLVRIQTCTNALTQFLSHPLFIFTSLVSHFVPFQAGPAGLLSRFAPSSFALAFWVALLLLASCFAFSVALFSQASRCAFACFVPLHFVALRSHLARFACSRLFGHLFAEK